ncbi:hypothetical protein SDC9_131297 [bioreactor metagenome]|uniref:Uncharacterized protein n=1 Tax=bioreactor metagenome TaxID=1076179 RepID=A0A645D4C3_9ZZZZ|nr:hypothetical protein [Aminivibrio sp.]MEA4951963.1 hypothetical protein [Aminivibrio sp.]
MNNNIVFGKNQFTIHFVSENRFICSETFSRDAYKSIPRAWGSILSLARSGASACMIREKALKMVNSFYVAKMCKANKRPISQRRGLAGHTVEGKTTRNRESESGENGDSDSDPDPDSDPEAARRAADVARIRILTGEKFSILEKRYWKMQLSERGAAL